MHAMRFSHCPFLLRANDSGDKEVRVCLCSSFREGTGSTKGKLTTCTCTHRLQQNHHLCPQTGSVLFFFCSLLSLPLANCLCCCPEYLSNGPFPTRCASPLLFPSLPQFSIASSLTFTAPSLPTDFGLFLFNHSSSYPNPIVRN